MARPHLTAVGGLAPEPDRRVPGRRGQATRRRLLESTSAILEQSSYRDVKVSDIARGASMSPSTFYQYFADVESAILVLAEEMALDGGRLVDVVRELPWRGDVGLETAGTLVDAFFDFWD